ncbi:MAG TPA: aminotransferase class V-fold PLP-dependent enzyme [Gemmatimonadaceae bacterium]|jgi:kynureninase|nr:aminotransferase class V-fold PLP-dependent enzyme [Gemmatimonadaceae bacterium]
MPLDPLLRFRPEFPILEHTTYLVSNSLGAMPRGVERRVAEYAGDWGREGIRAWVKGWWEMPVTVGDEIAPLIGAGAGDVVMFPNVTIAQAAVLSALDYAPPRDTIVMTALDFPSVRYVYDALAARLGARIVVVPTEDGIGIDLDRLLAAIDERTRLVAISHVLFRSAFIMDADAICQHAHAAGALVSLDAFHSVGVMPVDVQRSGTDFLTGGVLKWLCGGPGGCFLYVAPRLRDRLAPSLTGWQAHARPFAFEPEMEYAATSFRWLNGTPVIPALYAATEGPRIVRAAGVDAIRAKSVRQTTRLIELADSRGYRVYAPRDSARRGGTVAFAVPHGYEVSQELLAREILVDYRPEAGIRVAPHFYTSDEELERVVVAIDEILESGVWRRHAAHRAAVT